LKVNDDHYKVLDVSKNWTICSISAILPLQTSIFNFKNFHNFHELPNSLDLQHVFPVYDPSKILSKLGQAFVLNPHPNPVHPKPPPLKAFSPIYSKNKFLHSIERRKKVESQKNLFTFHFTFHVHHIRRM
jgi:hypothetical protein